MAFETLNLKMEQQAQAVTDKVFAALHPTRPLLEAVLVEGRQPLLEDCTSNTHRQHGFIRVLQTDLYGRTTAAGAPMDWDVLREHVPRSPIFDFHPTSHLMW